MHVNLAAEVYGELAKANNFECKHCSNVFTSHKAYFSLADQLEHSHLEV